MSEENINLAYELGFTVLDHLLGSSFIKSNTIVLPYLFAKEHTILPIDEKEGKIIVVSSDPLDVSSVAEARLHLQKPIEVVIAKKALIQEAIEFCYQQNENETKKMLSDLRSNETMLVQEEGYDLLDRSEIDEVIAFFNTVLLEAIQQRASDIHFEPRENGLRIRYRIDGVLLERHLLPNAHQAQVITRLKVMAKMDIAEARLPQDGRIKLKIGKREIDFRVSTIPIVYGERIALRILDRSNIVRGLDQIGMDTKTLAILKKLILKKEGIVLVTGPTGSGKTTTLYSALSEMNSSEMNIMTIEDPVEYKLPSIGQIGVNPKIDLNFSNGLRHILRQDPDVIMVGEIRDRETAEIAIQSALTGHLVLSTLHTNDAPSAITRLVDMGMEPYLLSSSIIGVLAQRLVRRICPHCRIFHYSTKEQMEKYGLSHKVKFYEGKGCENCFNTGFIGRAGIYELMPVTLRIQKNIVETKDASELRAICVEEKMTSLFSSGFELVLQGVTSLTELIRVVGIDEE